MLHSVIQGVNPQGRLYGRNIPNHAPEHPYSRHRTTVILLYCTAMIEFKKYGMKIQVGLGTPEECPEDGEELSMTPPYRIWIAVDGVWAPTTWSGCAYNLAETLKKLKSENSLCRYIERIL